MNLSNHLGVRRAKFLLAQLRWESARAHRHGKGGVAGKNMGVQLIDEIHARANVPERS